jgi:molecular chaperone DnaJ
MPISFTRAALGAEVRVPTLGNGQGATLTIPRGTQHGAVYRMPGLGLPNLRTGRRGDLLVGVSIEMPRRLSAKQEKLLRDFAETEDEKVLPESQGFMKRIKEWLGG